MPKKMQEQKRPADPIGMSMMAVQVMRREIEDDTKSSLMGLFTTGRNEGACESNCTRDWEITRGTANLGWQG